MTAGSTQKDESERDRFSRCAREVREFVARVDPELLDSTGVDQTLLDLTLSRSVMERLDAAHQNRLGMMWLQELRAKDAPRGR